MTRNIVLHIDNAIPHADATDSTAIVTLWRSIGSTLGKKNFSAQANTKAGVKSYEVTLDMSSLLAAMEKAASSGSFDAYRSSHIKDASVSLAASLSLGIDGTQDSEEAYAVATIFLQQLVLACNLALPGSFQMLGARFSGEGAHLVEAGVADSLIFNGARNSLKDGWARQSAPAFDAVWQWLADAEVSHTHTAIKGINKVLMTQLKVAEQRQEYSARTVLLVLFQLEMLLDCHTRNDAVLLRKRLRMLLPDVPDRADCIREIFNVRSELFTGTQPVHRPPLLTHTVRDELEEQLGQYNMAVVNASAMVLRLLQQLVSNKARAFVFTETVVLQ
jgi:hypothetical protein